MIARAMGSAAAGYGDVCGGVVELAMVAGAAEELVGAAKEREAAGEWERAAGAEGEVGAAMEQLAEAMVPV